MVSLGYLGEAKAMSLEKQSDAVKLLIVRKPVSGIPNGFTHFPLFSPTPNLLEDAQRWKRKEFSDEEMWKLESLEVDNESTDAWWSLYEPIFKEELKERGDVQQGVRMIKDRIDRGKKVYLFCYCKELCTCHRLLVGEYLEEQGLKVNYRKDAKPEEENLEDDFQMNMFA